VASSEANSFGKMVVKMLKHMHLVVLTHLQRRWSLKGREWFRILCAGNEMKCLFSTAPEAMLKRR